MDTSSLPEEVQKLVRELSELTFDQWKKGAGGWDAGRKAFILGMRDMGEAVREQRIREDPESFQKLFHTSSGDDEAEVHLLMAIYCLPDHVLDRVIATFSPDGVDTSGRH